MKKIALWVCLLLTAITIMFTNPIVGSSVSADADGIREVLSTAIGKYIQNIDNDRFVDAYSMTEQSFQAIIPLEAFVAYFNKMKYAIASKYKVGSATILSENEAELKITFKESYKKSGETSSECILKFTKEGEEWKICPDWSQFYSTRVDLLPPLAEFEKDGVKVTLKYIVLYPATEDTQAFTHVRIDIYNNSSRPLSWQLPIPGTSEGYLTDQSNGKIFYPSHAYGVLAKRSQDFAYIPAKYGSGIMLIGNNAEATLYIHITEIIPSNTKELNLFLSGLSFCDNNENWDITMNNVPCCIEVVPNQ